MVTAACLAMTSDCVAQKLCADDGKAEACAPYDYPRTAWIALWGSVVSGAMLQQWFVLLRYLFPLYKTSNWQLAGKVFVNQLVMSPGLNAGYSPVWQSTSAIRRHRRKRDARNSVECFYYKTISSGKSAPLQERARGQRVLRREPPVGVDGQEPRQELVEVAVGLAVLAEGRHAPHMVSTVPR